MTRAKKDSRLCADAAPVAIEEKKMTKFAMPQALKFAVATGALLTLGGCMYGSDGYYGDGYVNNSGYSCDPYAPFDDYYACDSGYGFANIGYGGGWYDDYYYPGYGVYIFDRGGRRHSMRDHDRRYWAERRAEYGGHHGRDRNNDWRGDHGDRGNNHRDGTRNPQRGDYRDGTRGGQRGNYRDNPRGRDGLGYRPGAVIRQPDGTYRAPNVPDRTNQPDRRPTRAVEQPQAAPQPVDRPSRAARPAREDSRRVSPRASGVDRRRVNDD